MKENDNQRQRRWLRGRYYSAVDLASAYLWLCDRSAGSARMGVDYERMAASLLEGGHPTGGLSDLHDLMLERKQNIQTFLYHTIKSVDDFRAWELRRIMGVKPEKIARDHNLGKGAVENRINRVDYAIEKALDEGRRL